MAAELNPTGRVFAAIVPPPEVVAALDERLRPLSIPGRRVPPPNWHLTLRFVGQIDQVAYERWLASLDQAETPRPFRLRMGGLGAFPRPVRATVLWVGVESHPALIDLAAAVDEACDLAGLGREERPYVPHLTISRVRPPEDVSPLTGATHEWHLSFEVTRYHVMAAVGGRYQVYESFDL